MNKYFIIEDNYRPRLCGARDKKRTLYVKLDTINFNPAENLENILGNWSEIKNLVISGENYPEYVAKSLDNYNHQYKILQELTDSELIDIINKNPDKFKAVEESRRLDNEFNKEQSNQWLNYFDHTAKKEPVFCFNKTGNIAEYATPKNNSKK